MEIFLFDLIMQFSKYHNIRMIYRTVLSFYADQITADRFRETVENYRSDNDKACEWLYEIVSEIKVREKYLREKEDTDKFRGALFKSYGQAVENNIIFTMDPENGEFLATDRKLAEHLDLAAYLQNDRDNLLRGEFKGDVNNDSQPIVLGLWSVESREDLEDKLLLLRQGAAVLVNMGLHPAKKLSFYQTTYPKYKYDVDTYRTMTLQQFVNMSDEELFDCTKITDDEFSDYAFAVD